MRCAYCRRIIDLDGLSPAWHTVHDLPEISEEELAVLELVEPGWMEQLVELSTKRPYCRFGAPLPPCFVAWMKELKEDRRADSAAGEAFCTNS